MRGVLMITAAVFVATAAAAGPVPPGGTTPVPKTLPPGGNSPFPHTIPPIGGNIQIIALSNSVEALTQKVKDQQKTIADQQKAIADQQKAITQLQAFVSNLQTATATNANAIVKNQNLYDDLKAHPVLAPHAHIYDPVTTQMCTADGFCAITSVIGGATGGAIATK